MLRLTISMPEQMSQWVEAQIKTGRYGNVSEYFRDLVRRDQEKREEKLKELRDLLDLAEASGISTRTFPEIMELARQEAQRKGLPHERN
ncbi:MAG: type II toxin-antitoxin system ParD family antitoxin [Gammaproteobacteria bacterium]|nr:type II toxin-antitoxin system ParD family antitoxin [Gammaproteobacteria bacterium]MYA35921.1 type II toxin-antitoxin system ParD family antitoxin [Gammaproteobacteria bacterium]MYC59572.1 type II toxin-antitoxin system ParD family antitoxin [Gammaproteobacteria bacterium]MYE99882.1 type II toxin-antitoxin system ParD family antitoxin [Gammaproteobacteria bacterium]MYG96945.1 type II toxin-antitoxin system ParD family antitoxin [Gammaproteobacteria bacterium]